MTKNDDIDATVFNRQRKTPSTPTDLSQRIIHAAQRLPQEHQHGTSVGDQPSQMQSNWWQNSLVKPTYAIGSALVLVGALFIGQQTNTVQVIDNPYIVMSQAELEQEIANLELQEIWYLQDELIDL